MMPTSPNDLDRTLSDYFKGQLPAEWPACRATATAQPVTGPTTGDGLWTSRTALAASVALVLGLGFYFSNTSPPGRPAATGGNLLSGATANGDRLLKSADKTDDPMKNVPPMPMP